MGVWWSIPVILALGKLRQEDCFEIKAVLSCSVRLGLRKIIQAGAGDSVGKELSGQARTLSSDPSIH